MRKLMAFFLCLIMCFPLFAACNSDTPEDTAVNEIIEPDTTQVAVTTDSSTTEPESETTEPEETTKSFGFDDVAKNDWDGYVFKVLYSVLDNAQTDFVCESPNGNVLNDQVYARNSMVETSLNISLYVDTYSSTAYQTTLQSQYSAGWTEGDYNMIGARGREALPYSLKGQMADLGAYDEINLYRDYWEQGFIEEIMIDDSIYALMGDISVKDQMAIQVICFNKSLFLQNGLENPYTMVKNYEWTVDVLLDYMEGFGKDYDNDGYEWDKDLFAISGWGTECSYGIFYGSGFKFCKNDGESLIIDYDREFLDDVLDMSISVWSRNSAYFNDSAQAAQHHMPHEIFSSGRGLFCDICVAKIGNFFTEMEDDYGILPEPMFNTDQDRYYSYTAYSYPLIVVPSTDPNPERTGNILECLTAASSDVVIPKMLEIVTKIQHTRDEESADMLDIALSNKIFDAAHWLTLTGYNAMIRSLIKEKENLSASYIKMFHSKAESELDDYVEGYQKLKK